MTNARFFQAIVTKYLPATNTKPGRIKATAAGGSVTLSSGVDALSYEQEHARAAMALANKFGWVGTYHGGGTPDGRGYVFVCQDDGRNAFVTVPTVQS